MSAPSRSRDLMESIDEDDDEELDEEIEEMECERWIARELYDFCAGIEE